MSNYQTLITYTSAGGPRILMNELQEEIRCYRAAHRSSIPMPTKYTVLNSVPLILQAGTSGKFNHLASDK